MILPSEIIFQILCFHGNPDGVALNKFWRNVSTSLHFKKQVILRKFRKFCLFSVLEWTFHCNRVNWVSDDLIEFFLGREFGGMEFVHKCLESDEEYVATILNSHVSIAKKVLYAILDITKNTFDYGRVFAREGDSELFEIFINHPRSYFLDSVSGCSMGYYPSMVKDRDQEQLKMMFYICLRHGQLELATYLKRFIHQVDPLQIKVYMLLWCDETYLMKKPWRIFKYGYYSMKVAFP